MSLINCLLDRCYKICSSFEIICDEFEQIKNMLSRYLLDKCMREVFNRKFTTQPLLSKKKDTTSKKIFICFPLVIQEQTPDLNNESQSSPLMIFNA